MSLFPPTKWAQREDSLFVTLDVPDVDPKLCSISLGPKTLNFKGKSGTKDYEVKYDLFDEIDDQSNETKWVVKPRNVSFYLKKKEAKWWGRLLENAKIQKAHVKVDFDKWKDEDEEDAKDFG